MNRAALPRADGGRQGDPLAAAEAILARAAAAGRSITLHERATIRQHVRQHEAEVGCTLLDEAEAIAARQLGPVMDAADREALRLRLDVLEALTG